MNKTLKWILIVVACFFGLIIVLGFMKGFTNTVSNNQVNNEPNNQTLNVETPKEPAKPAPTLVQTIGSVSLYAKNWNADPSIDGLELNIEPKDKDGRMVKTDATVSVKLWKMVGFETKCLQEDDYLLDTWSDMDIKSEDIGIIMGAKIQLPYQKYKPSDTNERGCAEVTLTTPDGQTFKSIDQNILTNYQLI